MSGPSPLWLAAQPLVLASKSTARRGILQSAGLALEIIPADIDERAVERSADVTSAGDVAALLAREKVKAVAKATPGRYVLGADQTLVVGTERLSKPADRAAAAGQLKTLSGRAHELHSAIAVMRDGVVLFEYRDVARMTMRSLSAAMIDAYLDAAGEAATASVGAYQIEGPGIQLFEHIDGDYFTILGLPLLPLLAFLRREKLIAS